MMTRSLVPTRSALTLLTLIVLAGCGKEQAPPPAAPPPMAAQDNGKQLYDLRCFVCHGATGKGDTAIGNSYPAANIADEDWTYGGTKAELVKTINEGTPNGPMRGFRGVMTDDEIEQVAVYVQSFGRQQ